MKRFILPILTMLVSLTIFISCSDDDKELFVEQETGEIIIDTYVDGELQKSTKATVYLDGGYATGAGKYKAGDPATVAAYPNQGYKLESFEGGEGRWTGAASYFIESVPLGTTYFKAIFKKQEENSKGILRIKVNTVKCTVVNEFLFEVFGIAWNKAYGYNKYHNPIPSSIFYIEETVPAGDYNFTFHVPSGASEHFLPANCRFNPSSTVRVNAGGTTEVEAEFW